MSKVEKNLSEKQAWYDKQFAACMGVQKTDDPPVLTKQIAMESEVSALYFPLVPESCMQSVLYAHSQVLCGCVLKA